MDHSKCDFKGWATKNDLKCSDGRIIRHNAFSGNNGKRVPLVWNHQHNNVNEVLGHAILENRDEGVYAYGYFNDTPQGQHAKQCVIHGDVTNMSIWANNLKQTGPDVTHGVIREVSLVLAGANPGAFIESVLAHGEPMDDYDDEGIFYTNEDLYVSHAMEKPDDKKSESEETVQDVIDSMTDKQRNVMYAMIGQALEDNNEKPKGEKEMSHSDEFMHKKSENEETVQDVIDSMTDKQRNVMYAMVGQALEDAGNNDEEDPEMKHNIFSDGAPGAQVLSHSDMEKIFSDAKRLGSLREAVSQNLEDGVLVHSIDTTGMTTASGSQTYGFNDPSMLFPEYKAMSTTPEWISRNMDWVNKVMAGVHKTPFSRIKSVYANITEDEARAKGYIKGKQKKEEVFTTLKRTTDPQTVYKKQKLDRDDIIDITDFDVVSWIKSEMRVMLNEELARAFLIGDGRQSDSDDKIKETNIRPIAKDVPLFNVTVLVEVDANATPEEISKATMNAAIRARKQYKGSGNPTFWTTEDTLTEMLLLEDGIGHKLYKTEAEVATALRVKEAVTVEPMENQEIEYNGQRYPLIGVIVNMADYNVGANKGGEVSMFDDFDIDYNQQKYLIETRVSGALIKPYSAITLLLNKKGS